MKLDKRIFPAKRPLTCFDAEMAKQFIGKECYFSSCESDFQNLKFFRNPPSVDWYRYCKSNLIAVSEETNSDIYCFITPPVSDVNHNGSFKFCLPCEWVQEQKRPQWRPFTAKEFYDLFADKVGKQVFTIRNKYDHNNAFVVLLTEVPFYTNDIQYEIGLGRYSYTLAELVKKYEILDNSANKWKPFGVEMKE